MRRPLISLGAALLAVALLVGGMPVRAAEASWSDPEGDATMFLVGETPKPSEPTYDILKVSVSTGGDKVNVVADFKQLGTSPPYAQGNVYRFYFKAGDVGFILSVIEDKVNGAGSTFSVRGPAGSTSADCLKCTGKVEVDKNRVVMSMPYGSLEGARREAEGTMKIVPGAELTELSFSGGEYYATPERILSLNLSADEAPMPDPGKIVL